MAQYRTGTVSVTNGDATVTGDGTAWVANIAAGYWFKIEGVDAIYEVASITDDTHLELTSAWAGDTDTAQAYQIGTDYTANYGFEELAAGDRDWWHRQTRNWRRLDEDLHTRSHAITSTDDHTSASTENVIQKGDANGLPVDSAITEDASDNVLLAGAAAAGTSAAKVAVLATGTAPTTCPADVGQIWVADRDGTAGQAAWHVKAGEEYNANLALGANLVHFAKEQMIASVKQIVTSGIELFLVFDEYGATDTIADRSGNGRNATLRDGSLNAINASTCSPSLYGLAPHLQMDVAHVWDVEDADGLSFGDGAGNDEAFSIVWCGYFGSSSNQWIIAKRNDYDGSYQEYQLIYYSNKLSFTLRHADGSANISMSSGAISTGAIRSFICTYDGSKVNTGINLYSDGADCSITPDSSGTYTGMTNTASKLGSYFFRDIGEMGYPCLSKTAVAMVIRAELTATQVSQLDAILRSWAGAMI